MAPAGDKVPRDDERRQLRPYRRFLGVLLAIAIISLCGMILRGIIRTLDRLPTTQTMQRLEVVDVRALRACAEDLDRLEGKIRDAGGAALGRAKPAAPPDDWETVSRRLEIERLTIVARCRLDEPLPDPAVEALSRAVTAVENLQRTYTLFHQRFVAEGRQHSVEARRALDRALETIDGRP